VTYTIVPEVVGSGPAQLHADWCEASLTDQPDVACWLDLDHAGDHEALVPEPCSECGRLMIHTVDCARCEEADPDANEMLIRWPADQPEAAHAR
jgi:hypothetical protein